MGRFYQRVSGYSRRVPSEDDDDDEDDENTSEINWLGLDNED